MRTKKDIEEQKLKERIAQAQGGKILKTAAQQLIAGGFVVLTERPKNMPIAEYKLKMRAQKKAIRNALR